MTTSRLMLIILPAVLASGCGKKNQKMTQEECSAMAENVADISGVPAMKRGLYEKCKDATTERSATMRCFKEAKNLADLDKCKETAPPPEQSEARVNLLQIFDGIDSFFAKEHDGAPPHRCAGYNMLEDPRADSGTVPSLAVDCSAGPEGKCVPTTSPSQPWEYDSSAWDNNPVFGRIGFKMSEPHRYHYAVRAKNYLEDPYGACQFTAQAFGDLDADSIFSTFERAGATDANGTNAAAGLYIDQELE